MSKPRILQPCARQAVMKFAAPEDLIAVSPPARLFARVVESLDLSKLTAGVKSVEHGGGRPVFCPGMLLTLWLYATSRGIGSAREIERLTTSDDGFKWIVGDLDVGRFAITEFRVSHGEALLGLMSDVLAALMHKGLRSLDIVALDGTRTRASPSAPSFRRSDSLVECQEQAVLHIKAVLADADNPEITRGQQAAREAAARDILKRTDEAIVTVCKLEDERGTEARWTRSPRPRWRLQRMGMGTSCSGEVERRRSSRGFRCTPPLTCTPTTVPASNGCAATAPAGKQLAPPTPSRRITGQASPRQEYPWSAVARSAQQGGRRQGPLHDEARHPR